MLKPMYSYALVYAMNGPGACDRCYKMSLIELIDEFDDLTGCHFGFNDVAIGLRLDFGAVFFALF